jgi:uncharacterized membrane protein
MFQHLDNIHTINHLTKDHMLVIQEWCCRGRDKKLTTISIGARVLFVSVKSITNKKGFHFQSSKETYRHAQQTGTVMCQSEVFICKLGSAIDGTRSSSITIDEISALNHEIFDLRMC